MKILFLIDCVDLWPEMLRHRFVNFSRMIEGLSINHDITFAFPAGSIYDKYPKELSCDYKELPRFDGEWLWYGQYHLNALFDDFSETNLAKLQQYRRALEKLSEGNFHIVITNSPWIAVRSIFTNAIVLNYELGIFNRAPLPIFHQFDPLGLYR